MPTSSVADALPVLHPPVPGDTPTTPDFSGLDALFGGVQAGRNFPSPDLVDAAAGLVPAIPPNQSAGQTLYEGPAWRVSISPGRVRVWTRDEAAADRTENRALDMRAKAADAMAAFIEVDDEGNLVQDVPERTPSREITGWSAKSRANMRGRLADLDYTPLFADPSRLPAMLTLTYPGCWLPVAPTGKEVKAHLKTLRKRYKRAFGEDLACVWKLEFQGRRAGARCECDDCANLDDGRAPHVHLLAVPPRVDKTGNPVNFREWLRLTWADIVAHPDPEQRRRHELAGCNVDYAEGLRATDPRRVATYFAKHGGAEGKEYQHCVPLAWTEPGKGPGRFWGYWVLAPKIATVPVRPEVGVQAGRIVRRHSHAQQVTRQTTRPRVRGGRPVSKYPEVQGLAGAMLLESRTKVRYRRSRTRAVRAKNGRGWLMVNDGARFGVDLAVALQAEIERRHQVIDRAEMERTGWWNHPVTRALRLPPSPRRDDLIARLRQKY